MKSFRIAFPLCVLSAALVASIPMPASASEGALDFRVGPAAGSELSKGGDYFVLEMESGHSRTQAIEISNPSQRPLRVQLDEVAAATAQMGGVDYGSEQPPTGAAGSWITLEKRTVSLAAGGSTNVSFEIEVPANAVTGVHLAGLAVWVEGAERETAAGARTTMKVQSRRVIAVQVNLPGPAAPVLEIRGAQAEARPDGLYLGVDLFNSGNGFARGTGTVSIEGRDGIEDIVLDTVVPRTGTNFPFRWAGAAVPNGSYEVAIEIDYGVAIATWQGQVRVGPAVQEGLLGRGIGERGSSAFPRLLLAVGAALLALIVLVLVRRKRPFFPRSFSRAPGVRRSRRHPRPTHRIVPDQGPGAVTSSPTLFVPRSEEQRRLPPPPPPPAAWPA